MIKVVKENDCVGCERCVNCGRSEGYLALDDLICDKCGKSADELYTDGTEQICLECLTKDYKKIDDDNFEEFVD